MAFPLQSLQTGNQPAGQDDKPDDERNEDEVHHNNSFLSHAPYQVLCKNGVKMKRAPDRLLFPTIHYADYERVA